LGKTLNNSKQIKVGHLRKLLVGEGGNKDAKSKQLPEIGFNTNYGKLANIPVFTNELFLRC
jgi:hypothetical protein